MRPGTHRDGAPAATVCFYISGHGFGHAVRQIAIINTLLARTAGALRVLVRTSAPAWLFERTVTGPFRLVPGETDAGVLQIDALRLDERGTIARAAAFYADLPSRTAREASWLRAERVDLVVADAPPLACTAARRAGIASVVCANFTWDWIYEAYVDRAPGAAPLIGRLADAYAHAEAGWRLPMHGGFASIARTEDVPLVARHGGAGLSRGRLRDRLGLPRDRRLALASFGGYGLQDLPLDRLDCTAGWGVVVTAPQKHLPEPRPGVHGVADERLLDRGLRYEDVVAAMDVVVTKPGYGIVSDCIASGAAVLYTSRGAFPEYGVLVREMPRFLRCEFLETGALLAGRWNHALGRLAGKPAPPERTPTDGAEVVASMILAALPAATSRR